MPTHRQWLPSLAITLLLSAPAFAQQQMGGPQHSATQQQEVSQKDLDFIKNAATGGMAEVELGKVAAQTAHSPDLKSFGARMVHDHSRANEQLATIAKERGALVPQQLDTEHTQMRDRLAIKYLVVGPDDHRYGREREARGQRLERMHDERTAGATEILLRPICAEPNAPAAGDDQKPDLIR